VGFIQESLFSTPCGIQGTKVVFIFFSAKFFLIFFQTKSFTNTQLWEIREKIEVQISLKAYLYGSVYNSCMNHIKRINIRREHHENMMAENSEESESNNPMFIIMSKETIQEIEQSIAALPEQYSNIITLSQEELSYKEIAQAMNIPVNSVGPTLNKARKMLSKKLNRKYMHK